MRHGVVVESGAGWAVVTLDGVNVEALVSAGGELPLGAIGCLVLDGRRLVCLGAPPP